MRSVHTVLEEQVEVARTAGDPEMFLLRGRLYAVRSVLARWREPGGWRWSGPGRTAGPAAAGAGSGAMAVIHSVPVELAERELWRVEAAAGMSARVEVFDLCRDVAAGPPRWTATLVEE
ncbi:MAG TPA: DUF6504 family protein [Mycobacteriales bacterium]|jgi:hypothetical protein